ncbi:MAG: excinuclease ABC subunit UvrA [Acidobacteriota bacterium]
MRGARVHNLKGVDLDIPSRRLVVFTGVSGSGKSSLAFDTLYAEGQRRYAESLSAYARQFLERMEKPSLESIDGVCPAVAIQQQVPPRNSRSTVGTATELQDYLRLLFARVGTTICPHCSEAVQADSPASAADELLQEMPGCKALVTFPVPLPHKPPARAERFLTLLQQGFRRLWWQGEEAELSARRLQDLADRIKGGQAEVIVDRLRLRAELRDRLLDSLEIAFREGNGQTITYLEAENEWRPRRFDRRFRCARCDLDFLRPEPRLFSFNNPYGACPQCKGFGNIIEIDLDKVIPDQTLSLGEDAIEPWSKPSRRRWRRKMKEFCRRQYIPLDIPWQQLQKKQQRAVLEGGKGYAGVWSFFERLRRKNYRLHVRVLLSRYRGYVPCPECGGTRLRREARDVRVGEMILPEVVALSIDQAERFFLELELPAAEQMIASRLLEEIRGRLQYLVDVGLGYLTLDRLTGTLSGGEAQRINLATCLGSCLVGAMYVLDEPSIDLHPRDNDRLIGILKRLRDMGNSVLVVEHDRTMIEVADHVIDLGPGAGVQGGEVVYQGTPGGLRKARNSLTGAYLRGDRHVPVSAQPRPAEGQLRIVGAREHNLKNLNVAIPLGVLCCVTGVSGSGKSTLIHDVLYAGLRQRLGPWKEKVGAHDGIKGADQIERVVLVDQSPIGRTPRSNPITYIKAFDGIRSAFARSREARARGYGPGHFSFNVAGGRCEACGGNGAVVVEMQFLPDIRLPCEECGGSRYRHEILDIKYQGKTVEEVLQLTVSEGRRFFNGIRKVSGRLKALEDVGLGYLRLGQPSTTLSGGEAQRLKLAAHLLEGAGAGTLYLFDEPTTGLHFDDIAKLLFAINRLIDTGASVVVIEHNLDFLKTADWIIDLGPEGGEEGGMLVTEGTPAEVAAAKLSHTGRYLRQFLAGA